VNGKGVRDNFLIVYQATRIVSDTILVFFDVPGAFQQDYNNTHQPIEQEDCVEE